MRVFFIPKIRKDIFMKKSKRFIALFLCAVTVMSVFFAFPGAAHAADATVSVKDTELDTGKAVNLWNGGSVNGNNDFFILYIGSSTMLYCLEPGAHLVGGDGIDINNYVNTLRTPSIHEDYTVAKLLGRLFQYVDYSVTGSPLSTTAGKYLYVAARLLTWEITQGERDADFNYVSPPSGYDRVRQTIDNASITAAQKNAVLGYYNDLVSKVKDHHKIPSFSRLSPSGAPAYELTPDSSGKLSVTLTDSNSVLSNYTLSAGGSTISTSKSGNKLTITAQNGFDGELTVTATNSVARRKGLVCYGDGKKGGVQESISISSPIDDPVQAYFKLKASYGNLSIVKTAKNNDGVTSGFQFEVAQGGTNIGTFTSGNDGKIHIPNLKAGT
jgi:hypothetical protein